MNITQLNDGDVCSYLASRVRAERNYRRYSQAKFSEIAGLSLRTYKRFELNGQGSIETLVKVLRAFDKLRMIEAMFTQPSLNRLNPEERVAKIAVRVMKGG